MATIKTTDAIHGVMYTIVDANGNPINFLNGQATLSFPLQPQIPGSATCLVMATGSTFRVTTSQATTLAAATGTSSAMTDADGKRISFSPSLAIYAGGTYESSNTSGMRLSWGGVFADLNSTNLTDINTVMTNFVSAGAVT